MSVFSPYKHVVYPTTHIHKHLNVWKLMGAPNTIKPRKDKHQTLWRHMGGRPQRYTTQNANSNHLRSGGNCGGPETPGKAERLEACIRAPSIIHVNVFPRKARGGGRRTTTAHEQFSRKPNTYIVNRRTSTHHTQLYVMFVCLRQR